MRNFLFLAITTMLILMPACAEMSGFDTSIGANTLDGVGFVDVDLDEGPTLGRPEFWPPEFRRVEDFIDWVETADAENFQRGRFYDCLTTMREFGYMLLPVFPDNDATISAIAVQPHFASQGETIHESIMSVTFRFNTSFGTLFTRVAKINSDYMDVYMVGGITGYFLALNDEDTPSFEARYKTIVTDTHTGVSKERAIEYIRHSTARENMYHNLFIIDGFKIITREYTETNSIDYINNLTWVKTPITDRTDYVLVPDDVIRQYFDEFIGLDSQVLRFNTDTLTYEVFRIANGEMHFRPQTFQGIATPFIDTAHNRVMLPLRTISDAMGTRTEWDSTTRTARVQIRDNWHYIPYGTPLPDGLGMPIIRNDRIFLPLRYIADLLDAEARWDSSSRSAYIYMP